MAEPVTCELCKATLPLHASYVVRIDVFADPSIPDVSSSDLAAFDFDAALADAVNDAEQLTADDLQDGVHRRFEYRLCPRCQKRFLGNPMGLPRDLRAGTN